MQKISKRENYLKMARREDPQWIPLDFGVTGGWMKNFMAHLGVDEKPELCDYFDYEGRWVGNAPMDRETPDWRNLYYSDGYLPENAKIDPVFGTAKVFFEDTEDDLQYFPLRDIKDLKEIDDFPWPTKEEEETRWKGVKEKVANFQQKGFAVHVGSFGFFETVWPLRGFEQLMLDMAEDSPLAHKLFDRMSEIQLWRAEFAARTGADIIMAGDDVATQQGSLLGDAMWRKWVFPYYSKAIRIVKEINPDALIKYHSCGNVSDMIDGFLEAGIDILNPCQPECMDIFALKERYGDRLSFHGGIGVQSVLSQGSPQDVREMTQKTIEKMSKGGGYLCSPSHTVDKSIPVENILTFVETVREYKL